jgi:DNA-binding beta-propeller fold protein YncE
MGLIQILNPATGGFIASYGSQGTDPGQLNLPLGIALNPAGEMAVASSENRRVEILPTP